MHGCQREGFSVHAVHCARVGQLPGLWDTFPKSAIDLLIFSAWTLAAVSQTRKRHGSLDISERRVQRTTRHSMARLCDAWRSHNSALFAACMKREGKLLHCVGMRWSKLVQSVIPWIRWTRWSMVIPWGKKHRDQSNCLLYTHNSRPDRHRT